MLTAIPMFIFGFTLFNIFCTGYSKIDIVCITMWAYEDHGRYHINPRYCQPIPSVKGFTIFVDQFTILNMTFTYLSI